MTPYEVDSTGEALLQILSHDAGADRDDIARQLKVSREEVDRYIETFERDGIILEYGTRINWQRVRQDDVRALIEVKVTPERKVGFDSVAEAIYRFPEVSSVSLMSGGYDLLVQVEGTSLREVALFVSEKLAPIDGIQSTVSHFILKKYKEDGVILVGEQASHRLPIAP